ncbi:MAG: hypothetical protein LQ350_003993 [Teloschistes chrysophthalmus]|nr:MAG: hypothetical protein LQ350_003993 [Niorma chrysophthalma]
MKTSFSIALAVTSIASAVSAKHADTHLRRLEHRHLHHKGRAVSAIEKGSTPLLEEPQLEKRTGQCQFPDDAGLVSVPGLFCDKSGKIHKPFPDKPYCVDGTGNVGCHNKASGNVAICQTVLPGNEAMLIPTNVETSATLAIPGPEYWAGTAAHFYVNPPGVSADEGCIWGSVDKPHGNWSPYVLGGNAVEGGETFIKLGWNPIYLEPATPFRDVKPSFGVEIVCEGDGCNGLPCAIDPSQHGVNELVGGGGSSGAGGAVSCVVTVPSGGSAKYVITEIGGSGGGSSGSQASQPEHHDSSPPSSKTPPPPPPSTTSSSSVQSTSSSTSSIEETPTPTPTPATTTSSTSSSISSSTPTPTPTSTLTSTSSSSSSSSSSSPSSSLSTTSSAAATTSSDYLASVPTYTSKAGAMRYHVPQASTVPKYVYRPNAFADNSTATMTVASSSVVGSVTPSSQASATGATTSPLVVQSQIPSGAAYTHITAAAFALTALAAVAVVAL